MPQEIIDVGSLANDGTGDPLRVAFEKINNNFAHITATGSAQGPNGAIQFSTETDPGNYLFTGSLNLQFDSVSNSVLLDGNLLPVRNNMMDIGTPDLNVGNIYLSESALHIGNITVSESANLLDFSVSVLPTKKADINIANATGNIFTANTVVAGNTKISTTSQATVNNTPALIFQYPAASVSYGKFEIRSSRDGSADNQSITIAVNKTNAGTGVRHTAYGTVFNGTPVTTYDVDVNGGNIRVLALPLVNAALTHQISYQLTA